MSVLEFVRSEDNLMRAENHIKGMNLDRLVYLRSSQDDMQIDAGAGLSTKVPTTIATVAKVYISAGD